MRTRRLSFNLVLIMLVLPMIFVLTSIDVLALLTQDQTAILNSINERRRRINDVPLVSNDNLNEAAQRLLEDIVGRSLIDLGDTLQLTGGTGLNQILRETEYTSYNGTYEADVVSLILRNITPVEMVRYWNDNHEETAGLQSKQMLEGLLGDLPIFFNRFREVGIAYRFNEINNRHYYVLIFASQPDVFPISILEFGSNNAITTTTEQDVLVHIPNYVIDRNLEGFELQDRITLVHISESAETQECPETASNGWQNYRENYQHTLSNGFGLKQLYIQLCDSQGNSVTETATITYGSDQVSDGVANLQVMNAVVATQTAAVEATEYAQILPTIEAILTATATAP